VTLGVLEPQAREPRQRCCLRYAPDQPCAMFCNNDAAARVGGRGVYRMWR